MIEVIVGNIGTVYRGDNGFDATVAYNRYVGQSKRRDGRASGEPVYLIRDDEVVKEHDGESES